MHSAISDAVGYILLLSSLIALMMLVREGRRHKKRSPFYILSTSDVFSSIVTAIALLASHIEAGIRMSYNWRNDTDVTDTDRAWTIKDDDKYKLLLPRTRELNREAVREINSNVTLTCDVKDVLMQYGILLAPLANALVSLLTFAVQCNVNATCVRRRCADAMRSPASDAQLETKHVEGARRREGGVAEDQQELASQQGDLGVGNASIARRIMRIFRFQTARADDKKPAGFLVTSHWLVPILVTAILCLAEYDDMSTVRRTEGVECVFDSNFPVNFYVLSDTGDSPETAGSGAHTTPLENYYFVHEEASNQSNSVEVNQIVSRVQNIVRNALSYIRNSMESTKAVDFLDTSRLRNVTDHIVMSSNASEANKNVAGVDRAGAAQTANDTMIEQTAPVYNLSSHADNSTHFHEEPEVSLLQNLLTNATEESNQKSVQNKNGSHEENTQWTNLSSAGTEGKDDATQRTTDIVLAQDTFVSDDQIYADILKRIHAASTYTALRSHRTIDRSYGSRKQPEQNDLEDYIARIKPDLIEGLLQRKNDHADRRDDVNTETENGSPHIINECIVSSEFLKLHLFILSFAIYFLPILLCCILQVRGEHTCETALEILKAKAGLISTLLRDDSNDDDNVVVNEGAHMEWLSASGESAGRRGSTDGSNKSLEIRDSHSSTTDIRMMNKKHKRCVEARDRDMLLEVNCMARICRVVKMSLILCVFLWSPIFLGTLLRVFSCIHAPQWLTDTTFLSAISFGVIRNVLNIYIIKIQELCSNDSAKENSIHPVE